MCVYVCVRADTSSASEDEGSLRRRQAAVSAVLAQSLQNSEFWINRTIQGSSTSSSASSTLSHGDGSKNHIQNALADVLAHTRIGTSILLGQIDKCFKSDCKFIVKQQRVVTRS